MADNPVTEQEGGDLHDLIIRRGLPAVLRCIEVIELANVDAHVEDHPRAILHASAARALQALAALVDALADEADPDWGPGPNLAFFVDPSNTGGGTH